MKNEKKTSCRSFDNGTSAGSFDNDAFAQSDR